MIKYLSKQNFKKFFGKTCLLRVDLNVEETMPLDSYRLEAALPTIQLLLKNNVRVVLLSHRGRPMNGESKAAKRKFSLSPFGPIFSSKLHTPVDFVCTARLNALQKAMAQSNARLVLLENLRFFKGEETNDPTFARVLAKLGDFYVNDAFAVSHRAHASIDAITKYLPSYAGLLMEKELEHLGSIMKHAGHPLTIIIGGAKISDKLGVLKYFWTKGQRSADNVLLGGGPANTFLWATGMNVFSSLVDNDALPLIHPYLGSRKVHLPTDFKWNKNAILDIGPRTVKEYADIIKKSRAIIWNGPMGWFEKRGFSSGTKGIWQAVLANQKAHTVIGGGETVASAKLISNFKFQISHLRNVFISTGGGAMLDYLAGKKLPGVAALARKSPARRSTIAKPQ